MDHELERYHKTNSNLELTISDNKLKLEGQQHEILKQRGQISQVEIKKNKEHDQALQ
jgi:hypothetical protein